MRRQNTKNMINKYISLLAFLLISTTTLFAQSGEIQGVVKDEGSGESVPFANIIAEQDGIQIMGTVTDFDGKYALKPLTPGKYDIKVSYQGKVSEVSGVLVIADESRFVDISINSAQILQEVVIWEDPLVDPGNTVQGKTLSKQDIQNLPVRSIGGVASLSAGFGVNGSIRGARANATQYVVDGVPVSGVPNIPQNAIEQMNVITGGVPAKYGDVAGGVINITTSGATSRFKAGFQGLTSQFLDPYRYNLANVSLSGPLLFKDRKSDEKKTLLGFFIVGEYLYQRDPNPSILGAYKVKEETLQEIQASPLLPSRTGSGADYRAEYIEDQDIEFQKFRPNANSNQFSLQSRFTLALSELTNVEFTAGYVYQDFLNYSFSNMLFNSQNNAQVIGHNIRTSAKFRQNFRDEQEEDEANASYLKNPYYEVQVSYIKDLQEVKNPTYGDDFFKLGYVGEFDFITSPNYTYGQDTASGNFAYLLQGEQVERIDFTPSDLNPELAAYTNDYYSFINSEPTLLSDISGNRGLINGGNPTSVYQLWSPPNPFGGYSKSNDDQYRFRIDGSVDIQKPGSTERNKHAIEFGLQYEQRVERFYAIAPNSLWGIMRTSVNAHIQDLDRSNPQYVYDENGVFQDTINYNRLFLPEQQTFFDRNLRTKLGLNPDGQEILYIDEYAPETFSLDMFSADNLLNNMYQGGALNYYGYDHTGKRLKSQPTLDDYFNKEDENGNFERGAPAFSPIYTAAYIQDKFNFRDLTFRAGVRIDRYDANQPVLKDPYSLYNIQTAGEVSEINGNAVVHPTAIGDDFKVYVNDLTNPTQILGYRSRDVWFDSEGNEVKNSDVLTENTTSNRITPYLVDFKNADNLELSAESFEDYEPQVNIMPRLAFSFPVSDEALFFAHYDVLVQRPPAFASRFVPMEYDYLERVQGAVVNNPNLLPQQTISYELGFTQALSEASVLTISAYYRELRNQVQVVPLKNAFPVNYITYGNIDFATVKGLTLDYELRRTKNIRLTANYTLQFANGTGLSETSNLTLAQAAFRQQQDLIRTILPTNEDIRHRLNATIDYRFGSGKDYNGPQWKINDHNILENTGIGFFIRTFSGTPYTPRAVPLSVQGGVSQRSPIEGGINSARLPWYFDLSGKIEKTFFTGSETSQRIVAWNIYLQVNNILNITNIRTVYSFTGSPDDDGFLSSEFGQQQIEGQVNPESFVDLYNIAVRNPNAYYSPRIIRLGLNINF